MSAVLLWLTVLRASLTHPLSPAVAQRWVGHGQNQILFGSRASIVNWVVCLVPFLLSTLLPSVSPLFISWFDQPVVYKSLHDIGH